VREKEVSMPEPGAPKVTADHDEIREWAEERDGSPALIKEAAGAVDPGEPRIKFSDAESRTLREVSWEEFFREFDRRSLALLYIAEPESGDEDTFFRFVDRNVNFEETIRPIDDDGPLVWNERVSARRD
jgi:hypothetical protein